MGQAVQVAGSLLILAAFVAAQRTVLTTSSTWYLAMNAIGSLILAVQAVLVRQWGFLLLEGTWAMVSAVGLAAALRSARLGARQVADEATPPGARHAG